MGLVTYAILDIHEVLALAVDVKPFAAKESTLRIGCETRAKMKSQSKEHFPNGRWSHYFTKCGDGCSCGCKKNFLLRDPFGTFMEKLDTC